MGINHLISFVTEAGLIKPYKLSNTKVVIDGNNILYHYFYRQILEQNPNDFLFGGNYTELPQIFETFFENLNKCKISPIIVFEGRDPTKPQQMERAEELLERSRQWSDEPIILPLKEVNEVITPILLKKSFKSVAKIMKVEFFTTKSKTDLEMAKLANDLKCPLISNKSDFLVMNVKNGVISSESIEWQNPIQSEDQSEDYHFNCQVFKVDDLIEFEYNKETKDYFESKQISLKAEMLPIFCSLLTKDGIDFQLLIDFFKKISESTKTVPLFTDQWNDSNLFKHKRWRRMDQLLCWLGLSFRDKNEAIRRIESYFVRKRYPRALQLFRDLLKTYTFESMAPKEPEIRFKKPQIEDFKLESNYESSIRLKRFRLGLLRTNRKDETPVLLTIRKGHSFEQILIKPVTHIIVNKELPVLSEITSLSHIERKSLLFKILKFKEQWITDLETDLISIGIEREDIQFWKYFLIVIIYWKCNSKMKEMKKIQYIQAFVQKLIYFRHNSLISDDFNGMTSVEYCSGKPFEPFVIHYYCEIQSIYSSIDKLVSILDDPIVGHSLHHYFNGYLLYNLFNDITVKPINSSPFKDDKLNTIYNIIIDSILKAYN